MSLNIPNAPNAGLFKQGYNKYVVFLLRLPSELASFPTARLPLCPAMLDE